MEYEVIRKGKCPFCGKEGEVLIDTIETDNPDEAINKAFENHSHENYGEAGAMTESDVADEYSFLNAEFLAVKVK